VTLSDLFVGLARVLWRTSQSALCYCAQIHSAKSSSRDGRLDSRISWDGFVVVIITCRSWAEEGGCAWREAWG
jgi:hypothetical protein